MQAFSSASGFSHGSITTVQAGWAGMIAGCLHSLLGPDHLVGLAPLTVGRSRYESAKLGWIDVDLPAIDPVAESLY